MTASELTHSSSCSLELHTHTHTQKDQLKITTLLFISCCHSQYVTQFLQLLQGLLTPALLGRAPAAPTDPPLLVVRTLRRLLCCSLPAHIDREGSVVKLQHAFLENRGGGEEEQGPDDGEGPLLEARRRPSTDAPAALVLPLTKLLQTTWDLRDWWNY